MMSAESAPQASKRGGMLRGTTLLAIAVVVMAAIVLVGLLIVLNSANKRSEALDELETNRAYCEMAVNEFSNTSDYLTNEVWQYALDGKTEHMENYWNEVDGAQTRDKAVQKLLHANLSKQEITNILNAKSYSDSLVTSETWAMRMLAESNGTSLADMPSKVAAYALTDDQEMLSASEKKEQARIYLYGTSYENSKQSIRRSIQDFHSNLTSRLEAKSADSLAASENSSRFAIILIVFLMSLLVGILLVYSRAMNRANRQLANALESAQAANIAKSSFTSRMSHEIRTPLNAVTGFLLIADQEQDIDKKDESIKKARIAANNLLRIVNDVLDLSAIENGRVKLAKEPFSITALCDNLELVYAPQAESKGVRLSISKEDVPCDSVLGDRMRLNQILTNLLSNAIKFTPEGGMVDLGVSQKPLEAADGVGGGKRVETVFVVKDTGIGMAPEFLKTVFQPYEQADASISQRFGGTGLGLSIAKNMTEMMGGTILVESEEGKGSEFTVSLPYEVSDETVLRDTAQATLSVVPEGDEPLEGMRILLVEDNLMNSEIAQNVLRRSGAIVHPVFDGQQAIEAFAQSAPGDFDAILMDIQMPKVDGYEATDRIRSSAHEGAKDIPIIAMTANAFEEDVRHAMDAGMNAHLAKPFDVDEMISVLKTFRRFDDD